MVTERPLPGGGTTTLGGGTAISGGRTPGTGGETPFRPVPAEFNHFRRIGGHDIDIDHSMSRYAIGNVTIRFRIGHFVLAVLWNQVSVCTGFRDIQ